MLTLSRKTHEFIKVVIPPSDQEQVLLVGINAVQGNKVRLGIIADRFINIGRSTDDDRLGKHNKSSNKKLAEIPTAAEKKLATELIPADC